MDESKEFKDFKRGYIAGYIAGYKKAIDAACELLSNLEITQSGLFGERSHPISARTVQKFRQLLTESINKLEKKYDTRR